MMHARTKLVAASLLAVVFGLAGSASAQRAKLHLDRADVRQYPLLKLSLTYVETDGRIVGGRLKEDFKLTFDSAEQGAATDVKTIDQLGEPVYVAIVAQ